MAPKPVVLVVIDGLTPSMFESTSAPALRFLAAHGEYRRATSTFPSLTPGLPLVDRDGRAPRRPLDPAPRLVEPRGAAARRVRLVVRRHSRGGPRAVAARHDRRPEREAPLAAGRDGLRGARGRGADDRGDQHHLLPRPEPPSADDPGRARRLRAEAVLLVLALRERPHRLADRRSATARSARSTRMPPRSGAGSSPATASTCSSTTCPTTTTPRTRSGPDAAHEALAPQRRGGRGADRRRRRSRRVSRALRRRRLLGPRPVEGRAGGEPRRRGRSRDGVEPRRDGLHGGAAPRGGDGSTPSRPRGSCCSPRTAAWSCGATATRTSRCSTRFRTAVSAPQRALAQPECGRGARVGGAGVRVRRSRGPPPRGRRAATARSRRPTRRSRCSTVGLGAPPASITGIKGLVVAHFGVPVRRAPPDWVDLQLRRRGIRDPRVLAAMRACPA